MSGIDERPEMTIKRFKRLCPVCQNASVIVFKHANTQDLPDFYYWYGRSGTLDWFDGQEKMGVSLWDHRTTYKSIGKHRVFCKCGHEFQNAPGIREKLIKLFRGKVRNHEWQVAEKERLRSERNR